MRLLYVTSFDATLYEATGARLIASFLGTHSDGTLLVCHEQGAGDALSEHPQLLTYDLDGSEFLKSWLSTHRDIIPQHLGGLARECGCPGHSLFDGHVTGCHWFWFNKNAARWFRKIVALEYARWLEGFDCLVWLDCDCRFKRRLHSATVEAWFASSSVFFLKSPARRVMESGVLGIRLDAVGRTFLDLTIDRYRSGAFREYERWDDGFQFQVTIDENPSMAAIDLAARTTSGTFVVPNSPVGAFIGHNKGVHRRTGVMI
jgi:hypothetical protein